MSGNPSPPPLLALTFQFSSKINTASSALPRTDASQVQPRKGDRLGRSFHTHIHDTPVGHGSGPQVRLVSAQLQASAEVD